MRWRRSWRIGKRRFWGAGRLRGMIRRLGGCLLAVCLSRAGKGLFFGRAGWVADWCLCCRCHRAVYHGLRSSVGLGPGGLWVY